AETNDVPVRGGAPEQDRDRQQRVEPAARLILSLTDEIRREGFAELPLAFERVVVLGEGHRTGVEPHVDHLGHALHRFPAPPAAGVRVRVGNLDLIHERTVVVGETASRELLELRIGADGVRVTVWTAPYGQRCSPVALA